MNALNGVQSDTYILQVIIQQELEILKNYLEMNQILKAKFSVKIKDVHKKIKRKNSIDISIFGYKDKEKYPLYTPKNTSKKHFDLFLLKKRQKMLCSYQRF